MMDTRVKPAYDAVIVLCPGRGAARSSCGAVRCRAGAVTSAGVWYGPGSAERHEECRTASGTRGGARSRLNSILRRLLAVGVASRRACENLLGDQPGVLPDRRLDLRGHVGIGLQERLGVFPALAEPLAVIGEP